MLEKLFLAAVSKSRKAVHGLWHTCSGKAPVEERVACRATALATYKGSFWPWKDEASWRTRGTAMWVRRVREGSGMETGPTGGSVMEDARVERSTSEKTSLHKATLSTGSCVGCCTIGAAAWSWVSTGRGTVSEGSTNIRPWVGSETTSSFSLCTVCSTRCGRGAIIWIGAASSTSYRLIENRSWAPCGIENRCWNG